MKFVTEKKQEIIEYIYMTIGVFILSIGISFFLIPNDFVVGGLSGLCQIISTFLTAFSYGNIYMFVNVILLIVGLFAFGFVTLTRTIYASILLTIMLYVWEFISPVMISNGYTHVEDMILVSLYVSGFIGVGVGLVLKNGGTTGGLDIPQKIVKEKFNVPFSFSLYLFDGMVLLSGILIFGIEKGMYAILTMYLTGIVIDKILTGFNSYTVTHIVSSRSGMLANIIRRDLKRGVTIMNTTNGYQMHQRQILLVATNKREYSSLKRVVKLADPDAFIFTTEASEVSGQGFFNAN